MFKKAMLIASVALLTTTAHAGEMVKYEVGVGALDMGSNDGFVVDAKAAMANGFNVELQHQMFNDKLDRTFTELGLGYDYKLNQHVSVTTGLAFGKLDEDQLKGDVDVWSLQTGVKAHLLDVVNLEVGMERMASNDDRAAVKYGLFGGETSDISPYLNVSVDLTKNLKLSLEHRKVLDESAVKVSWTF